MTNTVMLRRRKLQNGKNHSSMLICCLSGRVLAYQVLAAVRW